jgi:predicted membrane chloride channel (bestrophin family)
MTLPPLDLRQNAPAERYVDARELAALMGISTRTVKRMVAEGMPSETWGMSRTRRFLPSEAMAWARERRSRMLNTNHRLNGAANAAKHESKE